MLKAYTSKRDFVKDFLDECRKYKKKFSYYHAFFPEVKIETELWSFDIYIRKGKVVTQFTFHGSDFTPRVPSVYYSLTEWGGNGIRWDTDLRKYLEREICK